jgi:hypothetical protein
MSDKKKGVSLLVDKGMSPTSSPSITLTESTISVTAVTQEWEKEFIFSDVKPSEEIAEDVVVEIGRNLEPYKKQIIENLDITKTYSQTIEFGITWEQGLIFKITRSPKKMVKSFVEESFKIKK